MRLLSSSFFAMRAISRVGTQVPSGHACLDARSQGLPFCNPALPISQRVADLISRLTLGMLARADLSRLLSIC
jgi:hypothetical protein